MNRADIFTQGLNVYPRSVREHEGTTLFIARDNGVKYLFAMGDSDAFDNLDGQEVTLPGGGAKRCPLSNRNAGVLRGFFPFTNPVNHKGRRITIGLGDRLGLASAGHIRLVRDYDVFPVLAQQSIRELTLTGRTYDDVLAAAVWAVFQEGYEDGWGADGDHLKTAAEVKMALDCGYTMITLDCSEHIRNDLAALPDGEVEREYANLAPAEAKALEGDYVGKSFPISRGEVAFTPAGFKRIILVYYGAVKHAINIYDELIKPRGHIDFELSVDETLSITSPQAHYYVARELQKAGVDITSLAPRFCGEFQKGIDYIGDTAAFEIDFKTHARVAEVFGYKLSVHSGSDKFTVFPLIGKKTGGHYHLKTAGTNWLEAVRVIAQRDPALFRRMCRFALEHLGEAKKYYHITENTANIPDIDDLPDAQLPLLLDQNDARQALHITYGLILSEKTAAGYTFRDEFFTVLDRNEDKYYAALHKHIGRHLEALGLTPRP